jgi:dephospho-CoA kinase
LSASIADVRVIGLTGGIASGKSTVARMLRELGAEVVDADQLARDVVAPGEPALAEIVERFGPGVLDGSGALDRKALAARVFADPAERRALEQITHPRIAALAQARLATLAPKVDVAIYEAALLVEKQLHRALDGLIVVTADEAHQIARLTARDHIDQAAARARLAAQAPQIEKINAADYVIDNAGSLEETRRQVQAAWSDIRSGGPTRAR